jgi:hypothetical protein
VLSEDNLRRILVRYFEYYNHSHPHLRRPAPAPNRSRRHGHVCSWYHDAAGTGVGGVSTEHLLLQPFASNHVPSLVRPIPQHVTRQSLPSHRTHLG